MLDAERREKGEGATMHETEDQQHIQAIILMQQQQQQQAQAAGIVIEQAILTDPHEREEGECQRKRREKEGE